MTSCTLKEWFKAKQKEQGPQGDLLSASMKVAKTKQVQRKGVGMLGLEKEGLAEKAFFLFFPFSSHIPFNILNLPASRGTKKMYEYVRVESRKVVKVVKVVKSVQKFNYFLF